MQQLIDANDHALWRETLNHFHQVDVCYLPEYHQAYASRFTNSQAKLWSYSKESKLFVYPFLMTPVIFSDAKASRLPYYDISSVYGYSGPLSNSNDPQFIAEAWQNFDLYAAEVGIIAEFIRFSAYAENHLLAHPNTDVQRNRKLAWSKLPDTVEQFMTMLHGKTRNMIRKADKSGLLAKEIAFNTGIDDFRTLYESTMQRNAATEFFYYDDYYYDKLKAMRDDERRLFAVYDQGKMVAAVIALVYQDFALYHLGAGLSDYAKLGASNAALYMMSCSLLESGIKTINVGGGRTVASSDPLYKFKRSNALSETDYFIGTRILDQVAYDAVSAEYTKAFGLQPASDKLIFYR